MVSKYLLKLCLPLSPYFLLKYWGHSFYFLGPTIWPYGPERIVMRGIRAINYKPRKPVIVQVAPSGVDHEIDEIETRGDRTPEILAPVRLQNRVICIESVLQNSYWYSFSGIFGNMLFIFDYICSCKSYYNSIFITLSKWNTNSIVMRWRVLLTIWSSHVIIHKYFILKLACLSLKFKMYALVSYREVHVLCIFLSNCLLYVVGNIFIWIFKK